MLYGYLASILPEIPCIFTIINGLCGLLKADNKLKHLNTLNITKEIHPLMYFPFVFISKTIFQTRYSVYECI